MKPARHGNKFRTDGKRGRGGKRMHESSAFFCSAFDRKRHFKPEVTGRRHGAPRCSAIPRHCQEGRINKIKGLAKNGVWDFQAGKEHVLALSSQGSSEAQPQRGGGLCCPSKSKVVLKPNWLNRVKLSGLCSAEHSASWDLGRDPARAKIRACREERGTQGWDG